MSMVGKHGWSIDHLDVVTASLNPEVDEDDSYMTLPEGCPEGLNAPAIVVRLKKALYGLKQAPRLHQQNVNRSGSHTQTSQILRLTSPVLPITARCSQALLELSKVLSDSARAFSGAPEST